MRFQVDIKPDGKVLYEVLERGSNENCTTVSHRLVQGMSVESDERTGPDCDEVHENMGQASI